MNLTTNDLLIVIGEQTLTIKALQMQLAAAEQKLKEKEDAGRPDAGSGSLSVVENRAA